jgi:hypothetical protein
MKFLWFMLFLITLSLVIKEADQQTNGMIKNVEVGMSKHGLVWIKYKHHYFGF